MNKSLLQTIVMSVAALCAAIQLDCTGNKVSMTGGGTDVSNAKISGTVVTADGAGVPNTQIKLIPVSYLPFQIDVDRPGIVYTDTTDGSGSYDFMNVKADRYNIQAVQLTKQTRLLRTNIEVRDNDTVTIPDDSLRVPGSVAAILLPDRIFLPGGFLFIPGTDTKKRITSIASCVVIDSVPAGLVPEIAYYDASGGENFSVVSPHSIEVKPSRISAAGTVSCLVAAGNTNGLLPADSLIAERLNSIGVTATFKTDATIAASDIAGTDFILISPTAVSANLGFLKTVSIPCIVCRTSLYPLLDMTGPQQDVDYAVYAKGATYPDSLRQEVVEMRDVIHPISPNIAGTQIILTDSLFMEWGKPTLKAKLVASVFGDIYKIVIFTYDIGEMMISIPAPARRVGLSFHEDVFPSLNSLGWTLFENSVYWTLRMR